MRAIAENSLRAVAIPPNAASFGSWRGGFGSEFVLSTEPVDVEALEGRYDRGFGDRIPESVDDELERAMIFVRFCEPAMSSCGTRAASQRSRSATQSNFGFFPCSSCKTPDQTAAPWSRLVRGERIL